MPVPTDPDAISPADVDVPALLDEFLQQMPFRLDGYAAGQRWVFFFLFYADLKEESEYRRTVDDTYRMTHNPVNQHVALYREGEQLYSSRSDRLAGDDAYELCCQIVEDMERLPPLLEAVADSGTDMSRAVGNYTVDEIEQ